MIYKAKYYLFSVVGIDKTWLHNEYINLGKTIAQIAKENDTTFKEIRFWLAENNITIRSAGMKGKHHKESSKRLISEKLKGNKRTKESIEKQKESYKKKRNVK